jgi:hypothetical protein
MTRIPRQVGRRTLYAPYDFVGRAVVIAILGQKAYQALVYDRGGDNLSIREFPDPVD